MRQKDSAPREADQHDRSTTTVVPFRRGSPPRRVKVDDGSPPEPDDFDPGPAAA